MVFRLSTHRAWELCLGFARNADARGKGVVLK